MDSSQLAHQDYQLASRHLQGERRQRGFAVPLPTETRTSDRDGQLVLRCRRLQHAAFDLGLTQELGQAPTGGVDHRSESQNVADEAKGDGEDLDTARTATVPGTEGSSSWVACCATRMTPVVSRGRVTAHVQLSAYTADVAERAFLRTSEGHDLRVEEVLHDTELRQVHVLQHLVDDAHAFS